MQPADDDKHEEDVLKGTTLKVYRFIFKEGRPMGIHDVQRGLGLSSPSVAQYHMRKLLSAGLIREKESGYVVERVVFENMIRVRRALIPFQTTYSAFFATTLLILLTLLRPPEVTALYFFAAAVNCAALAISLYEAARVLRTYY